MSRIAARRSSTNAPAQFSIRAMDAKFGLEGLRVFIDVRQRRSQPLPILRMNEGANMVQLHRKTVRIDIGPFNGPLLLLLRPAITALAAGNCCVLKLSEKLNSTSALLLDLVPKYFKPEAVVAVTGHREEITELLKLPFDFIFFTGSTSPGKVIARAAAENLTPVLLELGGQNPALV